MQKKLIQHMANIGLALNFSSRLPLPCSGQAEIKKAFAWLPLAGIILALLTLIPLLLPIKNAWLLAWLYVGIMAWITRGLHWDGLADVADGMASNKSGSDFWKVVKDSKLGALGALCIIIVAVGYIISVQTLLETGPRPEIWPKISSKAWFALPWAAGVGRAFALLLPSLSPVNPNASLGQSMQEAEPFAKALAWLALLSILGIIFLSFFTTLLALVSGLAITWLLASKAKAMDGFNGDFLGAVIVLSELAALFSASVFA